LAGKYAKYKPEFRDELAKLVAGTDRSVTGVAREYGINETTLGVWVKKYRASHAVDEPALELSERARLREPGRENREMTVELAFLKKAAAYFAREQR
jgi:transposase